jgi:hypothetical protein
MLLPLLVSPYRKALDALYPTYLGIHSTNTQTDRGDVVTRRKRKLAPQYFLQPG